MRLRSLRQSLGWSLEDLAERSHLSPSTISRIETGKRRISIDVLVTLARALQVDLESLLDAEDSDGDVVIRPMPTYRSGMMVWPLNRPAGSISVLKMRLEPSERPPLPRVHPGHDWFFVLEGKVRLILGDRQIMVDTGEAAEFSTMTPHAIEAVGKRAELIVVFDREGHRAHLHADSA